jgi:hypothetical protein
LHHLYCSAIISFFFLTDPFCMLSTYHIIPIFIISLSYWFDYFCVYTTAGHSFSLSSRFTYLCLRSATVVNPVLPTGIFPLLGAFTWFQWNFQLGWPVGEVENEDWVNPCHNPSIRSRCGAQSRSCVCPCIAPFGAQMV